MNRRLGYIAILMLLACGCAHAPPQVAIPEKIPKPRRSSPRKASAKQPLEELKARIEHLLNQLASNEYRNREDAQAELNRLLRSGRGGIVLERLQRAYDTGEDLEVKQRLERTLKPYARWHITPVILDAIPNIAELLEVGTCGNLQAAIEALQKLNCEHSHDVLLAVTGFLIETFRKDPDEVRRASSMALVSIGKPAVGPLIEALGDKDYAVRESASETLVQIGKPVVQPLIEALKHQNEVIRTFAADVLCEIADDTAARALMEALKDPSKEVRKYAALGLGRMRCKQAIKPLSEALKDEYWLVRSWAVESLGQIGGEKVIAPLIGALKDEHHCVLSATKEALARIGKLSLEPLIEGLKGKDWDIRWGCVAVLGRIYDKRAINALVEFLKESPPLEPEPENVIFSYSIWDATAEVLAAKGNSAVKPLLGVLNHKTARPHAITALGKIGADEATAPLIPFLREKDHEVRQRAAEALGNIGHTKAVKPLVEALNDDEESVRATAARALGNLGDEGAMKPLIAALKDEKPVVRLWAAWALGELRNKKVLEPLVDALKDKEGRVRAAAAVALGKTKDKEAIEPLILVLKDEEACVRVGAICALHEIGDKSAVMPIIGMLKDADWSVRRHAIEVLRLLRDSRAIEPLIELLKDKDEDVRSSVAFTLADLTEQDFDENYSQWKQWYEKNRNE